MTDEHHDYGTHPIIIPEEADSTDADAILEDLAKLIAGLQVPISLGMGRDGILGTAAEPWHRLFEKVGGGWCSSEDIEARLRERLGYER